MIDQPAVDRPLESAASDAPTATDAPDWEEGRPSELTRVIAALGALADAGVTPSALTGVLAALVAAGPPEGDDGAGDTPDGGEDPDRGATAWSAGDGTDPVVDVHGAAPAPDHADPPAADPAAPGAGAAGDDRPEHGTVPEHATIVVPVDAVLACELQLWADHLQVSLSSLLAAAMARHLAHLRGDDGSAPASLRWEA